MKPAAEVIVEIPFHDVDLIGVAWHGHYLKYFELARTQLCRQCHCDLEQVRAMGLMLPIIDCHCRYIAPLTYGMRVRVLAKLVETEFRLKVEYLLTEVTSGKRLARGSTIQAVVRQSDGRLLLPVPPELSALLKPDSGVPPAA